MTLIPTGLTGNVLHLEPHSTPAWGDPGLWLDVAIDRVVGQRLYGVVKVADVTLVMEFGFDTDKTGVISADGIRITGDTLKIFDGGSAQPNLYIPSDATEYPICLICAQGGGVHLFMYISSNWWYLNKWGTNTSTPLYAGIANYNASVEADNFVVPVALKLPAPTSSDGFGTLPTVVDSGIGLTSTPTKVGFGGATNRAYFNGASSYVNIYSAALNSNFNGQIGSMVVRAKVADAAVWSDGVTSKIVQLRTDANNLVQFNKHSLTNTMRAYYIAGGTSKFLDATISATTFQTLGLTWSLSGDAVKLFVNGSQTGATATGLGTYTGALASDRCYIGTDHSAYGYYPGWAGDVIIAFGVVITPTNMGNIHTKLDAGTLTTADLDSYIGAAAYSWLKLDESYETDGLGHAEGVAGVIGQGGDAKTWLNRTFYNSGGAVYNSPTLGAELWDAAASVFTAGAVAINNVAGYATTTTSMTVDPLPLALSVGTKLTFSGGGEYIITTAAAMTDTTIVSTSGLTVAAVADDEEAPSGTYAWTAYGSNTIANVGNELQITYVDNGFGAYVLLRNLSDLSADLSAGTWYQFDCDSYINTGSYQLSLSQHAGTNTLSSSITQTSSGAVIMTYRALTAALDAVRFNNLGAGQIVYMDNLALKPLTLNTLFSAISESTADVIVTANLTMTAGTQLGLSLNINDVDSPTDLVICYIDGTNCKLEKLVGGTWTEVLSAAIVYGAGYELRVDKSGSDYRVYYNKLLVGVDTIADAGIVSNLNHGLFSTYSANSVDSFYIYPKGTSGEHSDLGVV